MVMVNFNGVLYPKTATLFNFSNRTFCYGDALFEKVRALNNRLVFWEEHYFRIMASMRILRMEIPMSFTMEHLEKEILKVIGANNLMSKSVIVTVGVFRNAETDTSSIGNAVSYVISAEEMKTSFYTRLKSPSQVELFRDHLVSSDILSKLDTNQKTIEILAHIFAKENNYADCILLNTQKYVVGTLFGSLFLVKDGKLKTPTTDDGAKNRVIREKFIDIVKSIASYQIDEVSISPFELHKADELFVLNISQGIQSISAYRKKTYRKEVATDLLGKLNAAVRLSI